ncbi:uncharacterized protein LOC114746021 [Neltuma alba]|uniref:uncharacterized protein LOC114746021 n=1 Tax=Neltuma alba TaxID=207710 RepID=UPI0010A504A5|nr:uncharacterized protein LOC114746021 [Prosopis alba]
MEIEELIKKIEEAWEREEVYWWQRSRIQWLNAGDRNTRFFHSCTIQRRVRNKIVRLKGNGGRWLENEEEINNSFISFYSKLFSLDGYRNLDVALSFVKNLVSGEENASLEEAVTREEIKSAAFQLGALKAPGPDGFCGMFYHSAWGTIEKEVTEMVFGFFNNNAKLTALNKTNVVLIPKVENAECVGQYRPIGLCNFAYKIVSKVLANRMKPILARIISQNQRAFIEGRLIQGNIIIAHEAYHYLKNKKKCRKYEMVVKIDMNKAYDRLEWRFIEEVMRKMGFSEKWIAWIMECVQSVMLNLVIGGKKITEIEMRRGIRQGDPLSPFLFIIAADALSSMVQWHVDMGLLKGIKLAKHYPILSHCFFANDSLFFINAKRNNCRRLMEILNVYSQASGQTINLDKSCVFFSKNTVEKVKQEAFEVLGISASMNPGRYLGLPVIWSRSKVEALRFVKNKMGLKVQGWKQRLLTFAGREIMIKAVANAIPIFSMSCFKFPKNVCMELDSLNQDDLWCKILKGLYFHDKDFMQPDKGSKPSWYWSSILDGRELLRRDLVWRVSKGDKVKLFEDSWLPEAKGYKLRQRELTDDIKAVKVADIIAERQWCFVKVEQWLSDEDKEAIRRVRIPIIEEEDKYIWLGNKDGTYAVKRGYKIARDLKLATDKDTPSCSYREDSVEHALFLCPWAKLCWFGSPLALKFDESNMVRFDRWFENWTANKSVTDDYNVALFACICWQIWKCRCGSIFEGREVEAVRCLETAIRLTNEFWSSLSRKSGRLSAPHSYERAQAWQKPIQGTVKINVDSAYDAENGLAGVRVIGRDKDGRFLGGVGLKVEAQSAFMAECLALLEAFNIRDLFGDGKAILETDCLELYRRIKDKDMVGCDWRCRDELQKCLDLGRVNYNWDLSLVSRKGNNAADKIAALAMRSVVPQGWIKDPPPSLRSILLHDLDSDGAFVAVRAGMNYFSSQDFVAFDSRKGAYEDLVSVIKDDKIHMIGLCGMGGSGKTTLVKEVGKEAEKFFDKVVFVVVSNTIDVIKIQNEIASQLSLEFKEEETQGRARRLSMRLSSGERFLIILDDIWKS